MALGTPSSDGDGGAWDSKTAKEEKEAQDKAVDAAIKSNPSGK